MNETIRDRSVHAAAAAGFAVNAKGYARGRPDYPPQLDRWLRDALGLSAGKGVLDLGAGTGKFTPRLLATGAVVIAVDPIAAMLAELANDHPEIDARPGTADAIPLADATVDAVVCAQAFHWFATASALSEIHRVLKPSGALGLIWNVRDESVPWVSRLTEIVALYEGDAPRYYRQEWRRVFPAAGFGPLDETSFSHMHAGPPEQVIVDRFMSVSFIAALPDSERQQVARRLRAVIDEEPLLANAREIAFPYRTVAYRCVKQ